MDYHHFSLIDRYLEDDLFEAEYYRNPMNTTLFSKTSDFIDTQDEEEYLEPCKSLRKTL